MLSTKVFSSSTNAVNYYSHADYYGEEAKGVWYGKGANDLGVEGSFDAKTSLEFHKVLEGITPQGRKLGRVESDGSINHRSGMDLTFSSPKSFSIKMHVLLNPKDKALLEEARNSALYKVLDYLENSGLVYTRKGKDGLINESVHRLTYALFAHTTNRKLEPQDHVHCLLANMAKCSDGKYRTIVWDDVLQNNKFLGQIFRNELAIEVQKLGYQIRTTVLSDGSSSFELKDIPQSLIDAFSTRRKELVELFKKYGEFYWYTFFSNICLLVGTICFIW